MKPTLLILAAGMGSRYGGLKQLDKLGPNDETIIDYSVYDAVNAGFGKVVFIIRKSFEEEFKEKVSDKFKSKIEVVHVFQELNSFVEGEVNREKPWGTGHAVLVAKDVINEPFAVINADDYYGKHCFSIMAKSLMTEVSENKFNMVGYQLANTMSENGYVSRGVCSTDNHQNLTSVVEHTNIQFDENRKIKFTEGERSGFLSENTIVSMNYWGLHHSVFAFIENQFKEFVKNNSENPKAEYFIPYFINELVQSNQVQLKVLTTDDKWYGVTYKEDKDVVVDAFKKMTAEEKYPSPLW